MTERTLTPTCSLQDLPCDLIVVPEILRFKVRLPNMLVAATANTKPGPIALRGKYRNAKSSAFRVELVLAGTN